MGTLSPIEPRLVPSIELPGGFQYPPTYLQYLLAEEREFPEENEWLVLRWIWPAFLHHQRDRVKHTLSSFLRAHPDRTNFYLVPFAEDAGDGVWFFAPDGIHFIDMGWKEWTPVKEDDEDFLAFVNRQRKEAYLPAWRPE
jgi:hypothetical protein